VRAEGELFRHAAPLHVMDEGLEQGTGLDVLHLGSVERSDGMSFTVSQRPRTARGML
jgi:hypothetical protein